MPMEKPYQDQELIDFIAAKYHYSPHYKDGVDLDETPLAAAFSGTGDKGKQISEDPELIEMHDQTDTTQSLLELIENTHKENREE